MRKSLWATGFFWLSLLFVYRETAWSMVLIWSRSDTFAHGFLVLPISLWLIWTQRDELVSVRPAPALWIALLLIPLGLVWFLASLVDVLVIQQLALVAIMVTGAWTIMGHRLAGLLAFPLFFLFFGVPMGEELIYPMMKFTASSTVWMIEMTGIPVYREGLLFTLPTGSWSVVEACSGVRYIIASVTLGSLYAYLTYRSWRRRVFFVLISIIVPVFANTLRAYIIVMLGHMSDMTVATGVDHLIYGWVFFGLVIFLLFWLGAFFRQDHVVAAPGKADTTLQQDDPGTPRLMLLLAVFSTLLIASAAPLLVQSALVSSTSDSRVSVTLPEARDDWHHATATRWDWRPPSRVSGQQSHYYDKEGETLGLFVQYGDGTIEGADVIGSSTLFIAQDRDERVLARDQVRVQVLHQELMVDEAQVHGIDGAILVWSWYLMGDVSTSNNYRAKLQQTSARLGFGEAGAYRIVVATSVQPSFADARIRLQNFLDDYAAPLYEELRQTDVTAP